MSCDNEFSTVLSKNAIMFLDEAVGFINMGIKERKNMVLAIVNIQLAVELSMKASIIDFYGIRKVLIDKQAQMTDLEIEQLFRENKLKVREYDSLKNFLKSNDKDGERYDFKKTQYKYMERFQNYRNQILHSSYIFSDKECEEMEKDLLYVLMHIIGVLMSNRMDDEYREFVQEYLNYKEYSKLMENPIYNHELQVFLERYYDKLYTCPHCGTKTVTPNRYCARCLTNFNVSNEIYAFVKCGWCGEEMVICDAANIENNNNMIRGLCLNCEEDTIVYKCPKCHSFVNAELFDSSECHEGFCKWNG